MVISDATTITVLVLVVSTITSLVIRRFNAIEKGRLLKRRASELRSRYRLLVNLRVLKVEVKDRRDRGARRQVFAIGRWPLLLLGI